LRERLGDRGTAPWNGLVVILFEQAAYCHARRDKLFASRYTIASLWMQPVAKPRQSRSRSHPAFPATDIGCQELFVCRCRTSPAGSDRNSRLGRRKLPSHNQSAENS
jgi:hypothetical protein